MFVWHCDVEIARTKTGPCFVFRDGVELDITVGTDIL